MAMTLHIDVVSAEAQIFSGTAEFVVVPAESGEMGILPKHAPVLARLKPGLVKVKVSLQEQEEFFFISGGLLEVQPNGVTILADTALRGSDLDEARAEEARKRAEESLRDHSGAMDIALVHRELAQAVAELAAIKKLRNRH